MLFFKKPKTDELLPPPPPFAGQDEEVENPALFDEAIESEAEGFPEEKFGDSAKELQELKQEKTASKKEKTGIKKVKAKAPIKTAKKQKISKKTKLIKPQAKPIKDKKIIQKKLVKKSAKKPKLVSFKEMPQADFEELDFNDSEVELPEKLTEEEIDVPESIENFNIGDLENGLDFEKEMRQAKPREILEAEDEIKSAVEKIKERDKPSFLKRLFAKKPKPIGELKPLKMQELDYTSAIRNRLSTARQALMKFDLEAAKNEYVEIMRMYNRLEPEKQAQFYSDIKDLYSERKSAEELKM